VLAIASSSFIIPPHAKCGGHTELSAADLVGHLSCRHLTQLDLAVARGKLQPPKVWDPLLQLLWERGLAHERSYVEYLGQQGLPIARIEGVGIEEKRRRFCPRRSRRSTWVVA
jgi:hypothetical protein